MTTAYEDYVLARMFPNYVNGLYPYDIYRLKKPLPSRYVDTRNYSTTIPLNKVTQKLKITQMSRHFKELM